MSYSVREIGVPSLVATGGAAGAAALSVGAGVAAGWPFPQAATQTGNSGTGAMRIQGLLENWLIWSSTQKKSDYGQVADAPGGGSLASTGGISPIFDAVRVCPARCCIAISTGARASIGGQRFNRQRVNIGLQEVCHRSVNQPVPRHGRYPSECLGHDPGAKMALAPRSPRVAFMQVAFIAHDKLSGVESVLQTFAQPLRAADGGLVHDPGGSDGAGDPAAPFALLLSHSTCGNMKIMVAGVIPYTLKWTQVLSVKLRAT